MSKNSVPYYIAGTLAALTLLASGVFAVAPYAQFLAPVAALSVGLPFIIGGAVFSAVAMALSYKAISKNKTISEKDAQLANQAKEIEGKNKTISEKDAQLANQVKVKEEEISKQKIEINKKNEEINNLKKEKDIKTAHEKVFAPVNEAYSSGRVPGIVKRGLRDPVPDVIALPDKLSSVPDVIALPDKNFESRVAQRKQEEENARAELKAEGLLPDVIALPYKDTEISSPESQPTKEENGQGWFAWSLGKAKSVMTEVVVVGADVTKPYFAKITRALAPNLNM